MAAGVGVRHIASEKARHFAGGSEGHELKSALSCRGPAPSIAPGERKRAGRGPTAAPSACRKGARARHCTKHSLRVREREGGGIASWPGPRPARHRGDLAAGRQPLDRNRYGRALGRQEPVLCLLPFPCDRHPFRPVAVLEPLSLRRASQRRRPAIADLRAAVRAVGAVRCGAVDPRIRPHRLRALGRRRTGCRRAGLALGLAGSGFDPRGGDLHVRRSGLGPAAAHRHHPELRPLPGGAAAACRWRCSAARLRSRLLSAWWRRCWRSAATTRPCCCASSSPPRLRPRSSRPRTGGATCASAAPCWRRWASSRRRWWPCPCC